MPEEHSVEVKWSGSDELKLKSLVAQESMGRPFWIELLLLCEKPDLKFDDVVGKTMAVIYKDTTKNTTSHFHGYVADFVLSEEDNETKTQEMKLYGYRATLVPWNWLLTRSQDCKIFQTMSVPKIIQQVCRDRGYTDFSDKLKATYKDLDYTVQYRESDFNFISRLMEQEGIYYFFEHQENKHDLLFVDASTGHNKAVVPELLFRGLDSSRTEEEDSVRDWKVHHKIQSVEYHTSDYDFEKPAADLLSKSKITQKHEQNKGIVFDYPGRFIVNADGENYAKINIQRLQARHEIVSGRSVVQSVRAGQIFKLKEHPRSDQNRDYLVIESRIRINPEMYGAGAASGSGQRGSNTYECEFKAIDLQVPFRPEKITPRPVVHGPQTAVVVGKSGEEIWTDKYGRIKVQFHWDREGKKDEKSSCWIRVAHLGAGTQWGMIHIPRMGQEVMVEFLEGDPDRPIVTGVVYNADRMPPYALPDNMTQSGLKTRSTKEGTAENFNELRFEDKKDSEEIYFHSEKDFNRVVENNDTLKVGFEKKDKGDRTIEVHNNETITIGNKDSEDGSQTLEVWKDRTATLKEGDDTLKVEKGKQDIDVKTEIHIKAGDKITLECGKSKLVMKKDGTITIDGKDIKHTCMANFKVQANANVEMKGLQSKFEGSAKLDLKSPMTTLDGSGMAKIKGGMVMIN